jgi:positive regulator of sigma E activity
MQSPDLETGTVLKTEGKWATVITNKSKSCRECGKAQAGICGKQGSGMVLRVKNNYGARTGDTVLLELEKSVHIKAYFFFFVLPVVSLILFAYLGHVLSNYTGLNGLDAAGGITGFIISSLFAIRKIHAMDKLSKLRITGTVNDRPECELSSYPEEADYLSGFSRSH